MCMPAAGYAMFTPDSIDWIAAPVTLPSGVRLALLEGNPGEAAAFTMRLLFPAGTRVEPHFHPGVEHGTVLSGAVYFGMGKAFDPEKLRRMPAGGFFVIGPGRPHFGLVEEDTIIPGSRGRAVADHLRQRLTIYDAAPSKAAQRAALETLRKEAQPLKPARKAEADPLLKDYEGSVIDGEAIELVRQVTWAADKKIRHATAMYWASREASKPEGAGGRRPRKRASAPAADGANVVALPPRAGA